MRGFFAIARDLPSSPLTQEVIVIILAISLLLLPTVPETWSPLPYQKEEIPASHAAGSRPCMASQLPPDFATTHFLTEGTLSLDLINCEHFDYRGRRPPQDLLEDQAWLTAWTQHWHLPVVPPPSQQLLV